MSFHRVLISERFCTTWICTCNHIGLCVYFTVSCQLTGKLTSVITIFTTPFEVLVRSVMFTNPIECFEHLVARFTWEKIIWMLCFHVLTIRRLHDRNFLTIKTYIRFVTINTSRMYLFHCILWSSSVCCSSVCCRFCCCHFLCFSRSTTICGWWQPKILLDPFVFR